MGIATLVTTFELNWRIAFWIGAAIAVVGSVARIRLGETPEFLLEKSNNYLGNFDQSTRADLRSAMSSYFLVQCGWPFCFYLAYVYFNPILKSTCSYSFEQVISHNFLVSIVHLFSCGFLAFLSYRIHPLKILKVRTWCLVVLAV